MAAAVRTALSDLHSAIRWEAVEVCEAIYMQGSQAKAFAKEELTAANKKTVSATFPVASNSEPAFLVAYQKGPFRTARPLGRPWRPPPKVRSTQPAVRSTSSGRAQTFAQTPR